MNKTNYNIIHYIENNLCHREQREALELRLFGDW